MCSSLKVLQVVGVMDKMREFWQVPSLGCLIIACLLGCSSASGARDDFGCDELARTFFRQPLEIQVTEFARRELNDQYALFICGNQFMRPPAQYLAEPFARRGGEIVTFLRLKLAQAQNDLTIRDIVLVFAEMNRQKSYPVWKDADLVRELREAAARMKNQDWKDITQRRVDAATVGVPQ